MWKSGKVGQEQQNKKKAKINIISNKNWADLEVEAKKI